MTTTAIVFATLALPSVSAIVNNNGGPVTSVATVLAGPKASIVAQATNRRTITGQPMMVYSIPQFIQVTYPASTAFRGNFMSNFPVNRTDFRMIRGVQNEIMFCVRDVDRKPVGLGYEESLTIIIVDPATDTLLMNRNLTTVDSGAGIYMLTVLPAEMDQWPTTPVRWSINYNRANLTTVTLWTDRNYTPYSTLTVVPGAIPGPAPTVVISGSQFVVNSDNNLYSPPFIGAATYGFSNGMQTFNIAMTNYTGMIRIDGSLVTDPVDDSASSDWFEVDLQTYTANSANAILNEQGNFLWMRVVLLPGEDNIGNITQVQYKN